MFRQKIFSGTSKLKKIAKSSGKFIAENPILPISAASLGMSVAGHRLSKSTLSKNEEQLDAIKDLTKTLQKVDTTLKKETSIKKDPDLKNTSSRFRQKRFSIYKSTIKGASLGAGAGMVISGLGRRLSTGDIMSPDKLPLVNPDSKLGKYYKGSDNILKSMMFVGTTTLIGAALGALVGVTEKGIDKISGKSEMNSGLLSRVVKELKRSSYVDGKDFTTNPKIATEIKTKICIAITKNSGDLKLLINTQSDKKLDSVTSSIIKKLPKNSTITNTASNKFNEIVISTVSSDYVDLGLIVGICDNFISSGNSIYLVEVG